MSKRPFMMGERVFSRPSHLLLLDKLMAMFTEGFSTQADTHTQVPLVSLSPGLQLDVSLECQNLIVHCRQVQVKQRCKFWKFLKPLLDSIFKNWKANWVLRLNRLIEELGVTQFTVPVSSSEPVECICLENWYLEDHRGKVPLESGTSPKLNHLFLLP